MAHIGQPSSPPSPSSVAVYRAGRGPRGRRRGRCSWRRWILAVLVALVVLAVAGGVALYGWAAERVRHVGALADYPGRPPAGKGTNWLLVGSDSRAALSPEQRKDLHVGNDAVRNTDTIMVLHSGRHGPYLVSLPRDSYVRVPGRGRAKINSAYAQGGPRLLTRTVEQATGLRIDRYAEVSFLGVVRLVDALGRVRLCLERPLRDAHSGADFAAGCHRMDGRQALAFVRARYADPQGDLGRVKRQRQLIGAVAEEMLAPGVLLDPSRLLPVTGAGLSALAVDNASGTPELLAMAWSMKKVAQGGGAAVTVPVAAPGVAMGAAGDVLLWNTNGANRLFGALRADVAIPTSGTD
ncbi:LCP family protein [Streptomyces gilvosporeus]|uniref:Transcriptional regulator n=1 Tax=Streptomyces gilvosporeus TaxID=553510 RepID=A0A1V0TS11_9ACTN|nr:LCP family protein [Streptomyces gilvosporeus]ARF55683.1 transcriptional regulator [Streptomyces gilvosporeus]